MGGSRAAVLRSKRLAQVARGPPLFVCPEYVNWHFQYPPPEWRGPRACAL